jgi:cytidylate kinase
MAIITISRGTFSGGRNFAECLAEKLGYRCISRIATHEAAKRYGVTDEELTEAIHETPGIWERLSSAKERYLACARAALISQVRDDNVIYHGLAGHFLLKGVPHVLRVRVVADAEFRIKGAMDRTRLVRNEAIEYINKMDEKRVRWTRFLYHVDWTDPSLYDLVLNFEHMGLEGACEIVCHIIGMPEYQTTPMSRRAMGDLVLSSHVKAILATDKSVPGLGIEVEASGGVVTLSGTVDSIVSADRVRMIVRDLPGVIDIDSRMRVKLPVFY